MVGEGKQGLKAPRQNTRGRRAAGVVMALALLLGACGGGDAQPSSQGARNALAGRSATVAPDAATSAEPSTSTATAMPAGEETVVARGEGGASVYNEHAGGGGGKNIVQVHNRTDGRLRARGSVQLNRITGPTVEPVNLAKAQASCTDCQTIAVALQINLIGRDARRVTPQNAAVALNVDCTRCFTVARASQYVYTVDDPRQTPPEVTALIRRMDRELRSISSSRGITLEQAEARINAVINEFRQLGDRLNDERDEDRDSAPPDATGTAYPAATGSVPPDATGTTSPVASPTAGATESPAGATPVPTGTEGVFPSPTASGTPTAVVESRPAQQETWTSPTEPAPEEASDAPASRATTPPSPTATQAE